MIKSWLKWGSLAASTVITLNLVNYKPAEAASFRFYIGSYGEGELSFEESNLTGIGLESANLFQFTNFSYQYYAEMDIDVGRAYSAYSSDEDAPYFSNVEFVFNNGKLIEIYDSLSFPHRQSFYGGSEERTIDGTYFFRLLGDSYRESFSGIISGGGLDPETGEFYSFTDNYDDDTLSEGIVTFETIVPVEPIPEPFTILGTGVAIGFSFLFKTSKKQG